MEDLDSAALKLTAAQFEELYAVFSESIGHRIGSDEYMKLFRYNKLPDFVKQLNAIQKTYSGRAEAEIQEKKITYVKEVKVSDCIQLDIDTNGNFRGFQIRGKIT